MDRRTTLKWVLAASAAWPTLGRSAPVGSAAASHDAPPVGYGTDPDLTRIYAPGELWPLTLTAAQRRLAAILADIILPADDRSPSASAVGVVEFIDEWVSAPYPVHRQDRALLLGGFEWLDAEAKRRSGKEFSDLDRNGRHGLCDDICDEARVGAAYAAAAKFFARYRDLTAGGFYSTPAGRKDLNYIGNVPLARFEGPPAALLKAMGLG